MMMIDNHDDVCDLMEQGEALGWMYRQGRDYVEK